MTIAVREIWEESLKLAGISVDDDFMDIGGHSLAAMRIVARTRAEFGVVIGVRTLFDRPTVAGFAGAVRELLGGAGTVAAGKQRGAR